MVKIVAVHINARKILFIRVFSSVNFPYAPLDLNHSYYLMYFQPFGSNQSLKFIDFLR